MAITRVQGGTNQDWTGGSVTSIAVTLSAVANPGFVCGFASCGDNITDLRVLDGASNACTMGTPTYDATNNETTVAFYRANITNAPTTFTLSRVAGNLHYCQLTVDEWSGIETTSPLTGTPAAQTQNSPGTSTDAITSTNTTPAVNGCLIYGYTQNDGGSTLASAGTGYTSATSNATSASRSEYKTQATAAAVSATFTVAANESHITGVMAFKPAASGLNLDLTGTAATVSIGTQTQNRSISQSGQASTASAGTLTLGVSKSLPGTEVTTSAGAVQYTTSGAITLTLTGQTTPASAGTLTPNRSKSLSGSAVTASAGTLTPTWQATYGWNDIVGEDGYRVKWGTASNTYTSSADIAADSTSYLITNLAWGTRYYARVYGLLGGVEQDPSVERELTQNDVTAALTGSAATVSAGTMAPAHSKSAAGTAVTAAAGSTAPSRSISAVGQAVPVGAGTVSVSSDQGTTVTLVGESGVGTAGAITTERAVTVSGSQAAFVTGTVSYSSATDVTVSLTGSQAAFSAGTVSYASSSITLSLSGSQIAIAIGVFSPSHASVLDGGQVVGQAGTINGTFTQPPLLHHRRRRRGSKAWLDGLISGVFPFRK